MKTICQTESREGGAEGGGSASLVKAACAVAAAMSAEIARFRNCAEENMGHLEAKVTAWAQQWVREALAQGAGGEADATPPVCPKCGQALSRVRAAHERTFTSRAGEITVQRTRGYCRKCRKWRAAANTALGLADTAGYSPSVQEMGALLVSKMPVAEASLVLAHLTGIKVPPATLEREVRRQGRRAEAVRIELDQHPAALARPVEQLEMALEPYQMILQIDDWNIRERDPWGRSAQCRRRGEEPQR